jgi:hypothetical protein
MNRRQALSTLLAPILCSGCGENAIGNNVIALMRGRMGPPTPPITRDYADKLPYASMAARLGDKDPALMVLARVEGRDLVWRAGRYVVLVTRAGRVVQTAGLPGNIRNTWIQGADPLTDRPQSLTRPVKFVRTIDIEAPGGAIQTINLRATLTPAGRRTVTIYGMSFETLELVEHNQAAGYDWSFTNRFWVDAKSGLMWQSRQPIVPGVPEILTQLMKPPQSELNVLARPEARDS